MGARARKPLSRGDLRSEAESRANREALVGSSSEISARSLSILAEAGRALAAPIDHASTLHTVARVAIPHLAEWAAVFLDRGDIVALAEVAPPTDAIRTIAAA